MALFAPKKQQFSWFQIYAVLFIFVLFVGFAVMMAEQRSDMEIVQGRLNALESRAAAPAVK